MTRRIQGLAWAYSLALTLMLVACGTDTEQELIAQAKLALNRGDLKTASIQIKNALEKNPESAPARFLFGRVLLQSGDVRAAEIELRKAQQSKQPIEDATPLLARSLLGQQQYRQVITDYANVTLTDAKLQADLSAIVAAAYASTGQRDQATALVDSVVSRFPEHEEIRLLQARLVAGQRDIDGALKIIGLVIGRNAKSFEAWRLQGDLLLYGKGDRPAAQEAYRKVLEIRPDDHGAQTKLIGIHIVDNDLKLAQQQYAALVKVHPTHPMTGFQGANIAFLGGDFIRARELLAILMKGRQDNLNVLLLAAATELQLNSPVQAENHLNKVLSISPGSPAARRLMAKLHLRTGQAPKALEVLKPLLDSATPDAEALSLAAEAHIQTGDAKKAEAFFARVTKLKPDDVHARTALALTQMAKGDTAAALADLRSIAASDKGTVADMALIHARLRQHDLDGTLKAIDALDLKLPDKPLPIHLRGRVYLLKRDTVNARGSFEKALARDPIYFPSVLVLAQMDIAELKVAAAQMRFEGLLKADPKNVRALVALAGLRSRSAGSADEVVQLLTRAVDATPGEAATRLLLVDHWLKRGEPKQAIAAAQSGLAANPDEPSLLDALGRAQLANDEVAQSLNTFGKSATRQPSSALAQLRLADAHLRNKNSAAAEQALQRALEIAPDLLAAQRALLQLAVQAKQPEKALQVARSVQRQRPKAVIGHLLEGDAYSAFKDWDAAIKAYRSGLKKLGASAAAVRLYAVLKSAKRTPEADRFAEEWLKQYPKETHLRTYLADESLAAGNFALARQRYSDVVAIEPRDSAATNNLAWVMVRNKENGAVAMAERALALSPDDPNILDTLAVALGNENHFDRAIEAAKSAVRLAPGAAPIRLNLAKLYLKANDRKGATVELDELAKLGAKFAGHQEVTDLRKGL